MRTENVENWVMFWDRPIGALIDDTVDFDRDFVAVLQSQLLAIYRAGIGENLFGLREGAKILAQNTDLFALLNQGASGIAQKLHEIGIHHNDVVLAHAEVDGHKHMPHEVPPLGLIAKMTGLAAPEICDQLLVVQAAARMVKNADLSVDDVPSLNDALNHPLYAYIGRNDAEPKALQIAQSYAHLSLIHQALVKAMPSDLGIKSDGSYRRAAYDTIAQNIVTDTRGVFGALGVTGALKNIDAALPELMTLPYNHKPAEVIANQISWLHHDVIVGNMGDEAYRQAAIIHKRMLIISGTAQNGTSAPDAPQHTL